MKKIIILLALIFPLMGCVPAALVIGATAGGAIVYDKRSFKTIALDKNSAQTALDALYDDAEIRKQAHISVAVFNRIALMVGQASTQELKDRAYQIVTHIKNIDRVYNEVTVAPPISLYQRSRDSWITTAVKAEMLAAPHLQSTQIKVITEDKVVYLMGYVTRQQADLAADVARKVSGVSRVVKVFQYVM